MKKIRIFYFVLGFIIFCSAGLIGHGKTDNDRMAKFGSSLNESGNKSENLSSPAQYGSSITSLAHFGWTPLNIGTTENINAVYFVNDNTGFVAGDNGIILKTINNGVNWTLLNCNTNKNITGIYFINANTGYIVGEVGRVIKTTNGGLNWVELNTGLNKKFYDVYFSLNIGWVIGEDGIIRKTTDYGSSWFPQTAETNSILKSLHFLNSQTGYIVGSGVSGYPSVILKTINGGNNWTVQFYPAYYSFNKIFFNESQTGFIAGTGNGTNGLFGATNNGGNNWSFPSQNISYPLNGLHFFSPLFGYAVGESGIIVHTSDGGINWSYETTGISCSLKDITYSGNALFAVGQNGTVLKKQYKWINAVLNNIYKPNCGRVSRESILLSDSLCLGTIDSVFWYVNNQFVGNQHSFLYSFPQGTSFVKLIIKNNQGDSDSAFATVTRAVYKKYTQGPIIAGSSLIGDSVLYTVATGDAVYRMDINGNFKYSLSVNGDILSSCSIGYDTSVFMTSTDNNLYGFSRYGAALWPAIPLGAVAVSTPTIDSAGNRLYVGATNGNFAAINKTTGTVAWSFFADAPVVTSAIISKNSTGRKLIFASSRGTLYGFNLNQMSNPPLPVWTLQLNDSVLVSPALDRNENVFIGTRSGKLFKIRVEGSTPEIIWQVNLGSPVTTSITIDADNHIYAGTAGSKLFCIESVNGNIKWYYTSNGAINSTPAISYSQTVFFGNDAGEVIGLDSDKNLKFYYLDSAKISCPFLCHKGTLYIGSYTGRVMAFYDSLETLSYFKSGISDVPIWGVFQNNPMRTGMQDSGLIITGINNVNNLSNRFELKQNYPNPFNPETKICFSIGKACNVKIRVYDILGREISVLVNQKLNQGTYVVSWQASNMPSGVYFCKIEAGEFKEIKKMIILK